MNPWQNHPYWYTQPHPHVYIPPHQGFTPGGGYHDLPGINPYLFADSYRSRRYPNLNPLLASDTTTVRFDVRNKPDDAIVATIFHASRLTPANSVPVSSMRLLSRSFPWTIDIVGGPATPITCEAVWQAIYAALQQPIADSEWGFALYDRGRKEIIEQAARRRHDEGDTDKKMKRIDWLGDATMFKGLDRDEDFAKRRLLPGTTLCPDTWMVNFDTT